MRRSSVKKLQTAVLILQLIALVMLALVTVFQEPLKELTGMALGVESMFSIPIASLLLMFFQLILYVIAFFIFTKTRPVGTAVQAGVLIGILYIGQLVISGCGNIITQFVAFEGTYALANYSIVNSLVAMTASQVAGIASILFCFTCGGYVGVKDDAKEAEKMNV